MKPEYANRTPREPMGNKGSIKQRPLFRVLVVGISGSGKSTFGTSTIFKTTAHHQPNK